MHSFILIGKQIIGVGYLRSSTARRYQISGESVLRFLLEVVSSCLISDTSCDATAEFEPDMTSRITQSYIHPGSGVPYTPPQLSLPPPRRIMFRKTMDRCRYSIVHVRVSWCSKLVIVYIRITIASILH